jgi:hypothetical protein
LESSMGMKAGCLVSARRMQRKSCLPFNQSGIPRE